MVGAACGATCTLLVTGDGEVAGWGKPMYHELSAFDTDAESAPESEQPDEENEVRRAFPPVGYFSERPTPCLLHLLSAGLEMGLAGTSARQPAGYGPSPRAGRVGGRRSGVVGLEPRRLGPGAGPVRLLPIMWRHHWAASRRSIDGCRYRCGCHAPVRAGRTREHSHAPQRRGLSLTCLLPCGAVAVGGQ